MRRTSSRGGVRGLCALSPEGFTSFACYAVQYEALKHVSFPLQTLGKCAKMIPVMVWVSAAAHSLPSVVPSCQPYSD